VAWIVVWVKIGGKIFGAHCAFVEATVTDWDAFLNIWIGMGKWLWAEYEEGMK
jgi:hypothetical protein